MFFWRITSREKGEVYYEAVLQKGLEGVMAKKKNSPYEPGLRSGNWLKIKKLRSCDCVIFGYTKGTGARKSTFGALLLDFMMRRASLFTSAKSAQASPRKYLKSLLSEFRKTRNRQGAVQSRRC